jgi:hypothetical protein
MASHPVGWVHNARMTTVSEPVAVSPRSSSRVRGALLGIVLIVVELLWARYVVDAERQVAVHLPWWEHHVRVVQWAFLSVPFLVLAVGVGLGARSARRGLVAVGLCAVGAAVTIGSYELITYLFTHPTTNPGSVKVVDYMTVMLVTSVATLSWCVSRRRGLLWLLPAVVVASASAAFVLWWHWQGLNGQWAVVVYTGLNKILPVVLACLVALAIDMKSSRSPS